MFLFDTHLHLDLYQDYQQIIKEIENNSIYTISMTNTPSVFKKACEITQGCKFIKTALGFHPELAKQRYHEIERFAELIDETKCIGEVGLDFSNATDEDRKTQKKIFEKILFLCANHPKKFLSIHSRKAIEDVLILVGSNFPGIIILHWFSGSLNSLKQALRNGFYFSINIPMLSSITGKRIVEEIPLQSLLIESDGPFVTVNDRPVRPMDNKLVIERIAQIKKIGFEEAECVIADNFKKLQLW